LQNTTASRSIALAVVLAGATVVGACSSSKSSSSTATTQAASASSPTTAAATTTTAAELGTPKAATGTPLRLGYITDGKTANIDNSSEVPAAQAAVRFVNGYLGGIAGHPITLDVCDDQQTPSGATDCGNQFATDKVTAVLDNVTGQGVPLFAALQASGIPLVAYQSADMPVLSAKSGAYVVANPLVYAFAGPAKLAQQAGVTRAAVIVTDVPSAATPAKALDPIFYKNAGVAVDIVAIPVGTADLTPQIQAELGKNPGQFQVFGDVSLCTAAIKAIKASTFTGSVVVIPQCITATSAASIPGGYAGLKLVTSASNDPTDPDNKIYIAAMKAYSPGTDPFVNGVTQGGFAAVLGFARAMTGATGDFSPAGINATITAMGSQPLPFGGGLAFQCNGKQLSIAPAVCSTGALAATLDQSGKPTGSFTPIDASAILKFG